MTPYYERDEIVIYCGECSQVMSELEPQLFDLTVTSPPYDTLRDYEGYTFDFEAIAAQLWRVTKPGGVVVWIVGDQTKDGSESGTSFRQALGFMELGFNLHDTMIYDKNGFRFPHNTVYHQVFEYMFVLSKGKVKTFNPITDRIAQWGDNHIGGYKKREADGGITTRKGRRARAGRKGKRFNIWRYSGARAQASDNILANRHPAIFPEALARDHIVSWSNPGDLVLDPMMGSGTTLKVAQQLGRRAVGIEISLNYCRIAVERLRQRSLWSMAAPEPTLQPRQGGMEL